MSKYIVHNFLRVATDFVPETFGRLTTLGPKFLLPLGGTQGGPISRYAHQVCRCSCVAQSIVVILHNNLRKGHTTSCGCVKAERISESRTTHGMTNSDEYRILSGIRQRCTNPNLGCVDNYKNRGIEVCARWREPKGQGFINFYEDMGPRPGPEYSIDRYPNPNGNYEPGNCRWADRKQQNRNKRNNLTITAFGETRLLVEWVAIYNIPYLVVWRRLKKGWLPEDAITAHQEQTRQRKPEASPKDEGNAHCT